ncbi:GNAT family N-acetyltransferase [Cytobacillus firmus]|uniref:Acetyltransferase, GNAT family n=1 Tax=Cytobacillus firmus TaxID=1399 RepID=A0A380XSJ3_CYTFI|nr:GNAT family N-acetyltransferase [Cytobacillus firmus]KAF0823121.1 Acetyltransferase, GNAT family [Cytobacillus firmus]MBG9544371.1 alanine acetyltransferase [Cytobacillus firmus]MBG9553328.1 alanine acetyltransferase [Cytobacillus firmus]MBG9558097.1 alanine acetyltransferase [Cytobacillus firmus]MBG9575125.1 alanine acetyltransferase [Cytobacillus firmus]
MEKAFPILETERLILREATEEDAKDMFVYLSDQLVVKHMGISACETPEEVLGEIEWYKSIYTNGTGIRWGITLKDSGKVIGSCGFLNRNPKHYRSEVGYELSREHWGKGIANEALERVLKFGFEHLGLERIEALIEPKNLSSQKLVERQGFTREGLLRHYEYTNGKFDDLYMYSILKGDL